MKIFITGSSDGLGLRCAIELMAMGHDVVLHARDEKKAKKIKDNIDSKCKVLIADLEKIDETKELANSINNLGKFDTIIHNAGVYQASNETILKVNIIAPYILTKLIKPPNRLIYIGSNMHPKGVIDIDNLSIDRGIDYSTSKLYLLILALHMRKEAPNISVSTIDPGWVATKMANYNAPDSIEDGTSTQIWLTNSEKSENSPYYYHHKKMSYSPKADSITLQEQLVNKLYSITKV
jgi:short-subunit dehydrogenase